MKVLFKQKQWIFVQLIFVALGIISAVIIKVVFGKTGGGCLVGLDFISSPREDSIPILFILLSDLAFNVEYVQGTFLTHLSCGQSRKVWMLKKSVSFYTFVLIQFFIAFVSISFGAGLVTKHFGLEGINTIVTLQNVKITEVLKEELQIASLNIVRTLMFVSLGVFVTTLLPGKLVVGSIASIGAIFIMMMITQSLYQVYKNNKVMDFVIHNIWFENPTKFSWICGILWLVIFTWLSIERVKRVEIASRGA